MFVIFWRPPQIPGQHLERQTRSLCEIVERCWVMLEAFFPRHYRTRSLELVSKLLARHFNFCIVMETRTADSSLQCQDMPSIYNSTHTSACIGEAQNPESLEFTFGQVEKVDRSPLHLKYQEDVTATKSKQATTGTSAKATSAPPAASIVSIINIRFPFTHTSLRQISKDGQKTK